MPVRLPCVADWWAHRRFHHGNRYGSITRSMTAKTLRSASEVSSIRRATNRHRQMTLQIVIEIGAGWPDSAALHRGRARRPSARLLSVIVSGVRSLSWLKAVRIVAGLFVVCFPGAGNAQTFRAEQ